MKLVGLLSHLINRAYSPSPWRERDGQARGSSNSTRTSRPIQKACVSRRGRGIGDCFPCPLNADGEGGKPIRIFSPSSAVGCGNSSSPPPDPALTSARGTFHDANPPRPILVVDKFRLTCSSWISRGVPICSRWPFEKMTMRLETVHRFLPGRESEHGGDV